MPMPRFQGELSVAVSSFLPGSQSSLERCHRKPTPASALGETEGRRQSSARGIGAEGGQECRGWGEQGDGGLRRRKLGASRDVAVEGTPPDSVPGWESVCLNTQGKVTPKVGHPGRWSPSSVHRLPFPLENCSQFWVGALGCQAPHLGPGGSLQEMSNSESGSVGLLLRFS